MQSLRMDEPDMLLMDEHGGDDDTDPFTARCMSFQVTSTAARARTLLSSHTVLGTCSRHVFYACLKSWIQPDDHLHVLVCTSSALCIFSWFCTPAVCSKEAKSSRRSSATETCCGHCPALTSSSANGPSRCAGNSSRKSCPMFQLQNVIPVKR